MASSRGRDQRGRFAKGHQKLEGAGRPKGSANVVTRTLRQQVIDGLADIATFVSELKQNNPVAAAALLARLLPPNDAPENGDRVTQIEVVRMPRGKFLTQEEANALARREPLEPVEDGMLIEHQPEPPIKDVTPRSASGDALIMERAFEEVNDTTAEEERTINNLKNQVTELARKVGVSIDV
jgi:hypothetical protein